MSADPLRDALGDLLLGSRCVGCERPGRLVCPRCRASLPRAARLMWPVPTPPGLAPPHATADYDGLPRALVLGLKERRMLALARPLGDLLAVAVAAATDDVGGPIVLVPVPSRRSSVRARGHDPTHTITRLAAARLAARGHDVVVHRMLRLRAGVLDQAGLDASARAANLTWSMTCPGPELVRLARRRPRARLVVCDDVLTTGATAREAQRALEMVGLTVHAIAAVAATRRRWATGRDDLHRETLVPTSDRTFGPTSGPAFRGTQARTHVSIWSPSGSVVASSRQCRDD